MSNEDDNGQLSLDDSSLAFVNDGTFGVDSMSDQSIQNDELTRSLLDPNSIWDFQGSPSFDTYDNTSADSTQPEYVTPSWQFPSLDELGSNSPANGGSNASPGIDPNGLFSPANFMMPPSENSGAARPRSTTTLTPAVHEKLKSIAMPAHFKYTSPNASSPDSNRSDTKAGIISSPDDTGAHQSRKRKVSSEPEDEEDDDDDDKPVKKTAHNMIEKRYRTNINDKIAALRDSVPSLRIMSKSARGEDTTVDREELHGLTPAHKLNKATVLSKATEYIRHLEKRNHRLLDENGAMQARIAAFEKLFMAGAMNGSIGPVQQPPSQMQYGQDGQQQFMGSPMPQQEGGEAPAGMIQVPDDMRRILAAQMAAGQPYPVPAQSFRGANPAVIRQQQIQQQQVQQQQQGNWSNASPYFGKLMVGSLAGLMILEAVREDEQSNENPDGRGLFAVPLQLLRSASSSLDLHVMGYHVHTSIKLLLFLGVFLWAFVPSLFRPSDDNPKKRNGAYLRAAPSLASSIEVRRQAWLTSIQTVWVPRHNFFLEAAALMLKTAKLSLRNIIGVHGYQALTGLSEEEETARVKAWSIALDSQLAGGDVDVCKSRLVLTLLASGTLPSTPQRLMLKALHIRVLLWDLSQSRMQLGLVNTIAAKLARTQWNEARQLNRLLIQLRDDSSAAKESELPEHLALLIERECDDVLTDSVIQRAHNLAFNRETSYDVAHPIDGMDSVVEDVYVSSPLDAVAAWWSTEVLHGVLTTALEKEAKTDVKNEDIETAIKVAPVGSVAMLRATLARAVLIKQGRGASIAASLKALGSERIESPFRESKLVVGSGPHASNPDLLLTLRCAVAIGQLSRAEGAVVTPSQSLRVVEALLSPKMTAEMTLLGFTSVMTLLEQIMQDKTEEAAFDRTLEKISGNLRIWIGGNAGTATGLDSDVRDKVVKRCLSITKTLVGMAVDSGHASMSDMSDADSID